MSHPPAIRSRRIRELGLSFAGSDIPAMLRIWGAGLNGPAWGFSTARSASLSLSPKPTQPMPAEAMITMAAMDGDAEPLVAGLWVTGHCPVHPCRTMQKIRVQGLGVLASPTRQIRILFYSYDIIGSL